MDDVELRNFVNTAFLDEYYFHKHVVYSPQHEYRLAFVTDRKTQNEIFIESKSAAEFFLYFLGENGT